MLGRVELGVGVGVGLGLRWGGVICRSRSKDRVVGMDRIWDMSSCRVRVSISCSGRAMS